MLLFPATLWADDLEALAPTSWSVSTLLANDWIGGTHPSQDTDLDFLLALDAPALLGQWVGLHTALALRHDLAEHGDSALLEEPNPGQLSADGDYRYALDDLSLRFGDADGLQVRVGRQRALRGATSDEVAATTGLLSSGTQLWAEAGQWSDLYQRGGCSQCWMGGAALSQRWSSGEVSLSLVHLLDTSAKLAATQRLGSEGFGMFLETELESWFAAEEFIQHARGSARGWWSWAAWEISAQRAAATSLTHPLVHGGEAVFVAPTRELEWPGFVEVGTELDAVFDGAQMPRPGREASSPAEEAWAPKSQVGVLGRWRRLDAASDGLPWLAPEVFGVGVSALVQAEWIAAELAAERLQPLGTGQGHWTSATILRSRVGDAFTVSGRLDLGNPEDMESFWNHPTRRRVALELLWSVPVEGLGQSALRAQYWASEVVGVGSVVHQLGLTWTLGSGRIGEVQSGLAR